MSDLFALEPVDDDLFPALEPLSEDVFEMETLQTISTHDFPKNDLIEEDILGPRLGLGAPVALLPSYPREHSFMTNSPLESALRKVHSLENELAMIRNDRDHLRDVVQRLTSEQAQLEEENRRERDAHEECLQELEHMREQLSKATAPPPSPISDSPPQRQHAIKPQVPQLVLAPVNANPKKRPANPATIWPEQFSDVAVTASTHPDLFENGLVTDDPNISVQMFKAVFAQNTVLCTRKIKSKEQFWQAYSGQCNQLSHFVPYTRLLCSPAPAFVVVSAERNSNGNWVPDHACTKPVELPVLDNGLVELYHFCFSNARTARKTQFRLRISFPGTDVFTRSFLIGCPSSVSHFKSALATKRQRK